MQDVCVKAAVRGKVQGVFYRQETKQKADELGLTGYAHNHDDGSVEVVVCGNPLKVEKLLLWMEDGPSQAEVSSIEATDMVFKHFDVFSTG